MRTNLNAGTGYDCAKQNNANGWPNILSIFKNLKSAGTAGALAPIGSVIKPKKKTNRLL